MNRGHFHGHAGAKRSSRRFLPGVGDALERREVLSGAVATPTDTPPADMATTATTTTIAAQDEGTVAHDRTAELTTTAARSRPTPTQAAASRAAAQVTRWNSPSAWRWINGKWSTRLRADLLAELVRQSGGSSSTVTEVKSSDTWSASAAGVKVHASDATPGAADEPAVRFNANGKPTFRFGVTDANGGQTSVILTAASASTGSITFRGEVASSNQEGGSATMTPLTVTVRRNGARGFQILSDIGDAPVTTRLLTYTATKAPAARPAATAKK